MASDAARPAADEASIDARAPEVRRTSAPPGPRRARCQAAGCTARAGEWCSCGPCCDFAAADLPVAKPCSETTREAHGAASRLCAELLVCYRTLAGVIFTVAAIRSSMSIYNPGYDDIKRYDVQCDFVDKTSGCRCGEWGLWGNQAPEGKNPNSAKARQVGIYCRRHAQQEERFRGGREEANRRYQFEYPKEARKRAREQQNPKMWGGKKKSHGSPDEVRKQMVVTWLGTRRFKELDPQRCRAVYAQLRIPPPLLGDSPDRTRIYLLDSFALADLDYLYKARPSDGRRLYLVRGSSIIR